MSKSSARIVVTIDGLAASGKSTLAKMLAKELRFSHLNTGLLYRAVALLASENNVLPQNGNAIIELVAKHRFNFKYSPDTGSRLLIDDVDRNSDLMSLEVAAFTSKIAALPELRETIKSHQLNSFPGESIVAEGRDLGTVIFPQADVKFFVDGDPLIRAARRAKELKGQMSEQELQEMTISVAQELRERDERDSKREVAPLMPAADAVVIDNTQGELGETVKKMVEIVKSKIS